MSAMDKYVKAGRELLNEILEALADSVSLDTHSFSRYFDRDKSEISVLINYYPPCPKPDLTMGLVQHTDASVLTLLTQFGSSNGLQVFKQGQWITVPWPCNSLLVNFGDFRDNEQRKAQELVASGRSPIEYGSSFFGPLLQLAGPSRDWASEDGEPIKYKRIVLAEYLKQFYKSSPMPNKGFIDNMLIK